ncbi:MAG: hypothetical protein GXP23_06985 [Gammaproteobacteria bacterium]|nr:hypothetical protein [Gammaproteobacteria bacterium]
MTIQNGATSLAEGKYAFKTDVNFIFGKQQRIERTYVLRTTFHSLAEWKIRNPHIELSPFKSQNSAVVKYASIIDGEVWVFGINATQARDIVAAVKIASLYYRVKPSVFLQDIYTKNLNAEHEDKMTYEGLIRANIDLYTEVCGALIDAAKQLGVSHQLNFHVFSKNNNPKMPRNDLVKSLKAGGAESIETDEHCPRVMVGDNLGERSIDQFTHFHLAILKV